MLAGFFLRPGGGVRPPRATQGGLPGSRAPPPGAGVPENRSHFFSNQKKRVRPPGWVNDFKKKPGCLGGLRKGASDQNPAVELVLDPLVGEATDHRGPLLEGVGVHVPPGGQLPKYIDPYLIIMTQINK